MNKEMTSDSDSTFQPTEEVVWIPSQFKPKNMSEARELADKPADTSANEGQRKRQIREYTLGEEIANAVIHGIGVCLSIAAIPVLVVMALQKGGGVYLAASLIYSIAMLMEYVMSTLYHAISAEKAKKIFKILDHSFIYIFIAGSYTPFCLITLADHGGLWLCLFIWAIAVIGVSLEAFWVFRPRWISALLYLLMGWSVVWFLPTVITLLPAAGMWLFLGGGILYSAGCIFYVLKKIPYMHSIFHLFVLAASICHFLAIALYVIM